ncbi:MAG: hypothetical protein PVF70_07600 [Anaerolineales bacterium]|jgi:hypothetical protein
MDTKTKWYLAVSDAKHARQVVVHFPSEAQVPSRVKGVFVGPMMRAHSQNWAAMTLYMDGGQGPFIFAKANNVIEILKGCPAEVAFSFYRYKAGGLLQIFVHVHSSTLEKRGPYPYIVENGHWPDNEDSQDLIGALIARQELEICFLADTAGGPLEGFFGLRVSMPAELREALQEEWKALNDYHASTPSSKRSFQGAMRQFESENPMEQNPILKEA